MARTQLIPQPPAEMTTINLIRLLARLEQKLPTIAQGDLSGPVGPLPNAIERRKIAANLEYARQLLLQLETEYATMKMSAQRKKVQEELRGKKVEIRRLNERLHAVEQVEAAMEEEEEREAEEGKVQADGDGKRADDTEEDGAGGRRSVEKGHDATLRNRFGGSTPNSTNTGHTTSHKPHPTTSTTTTSVSTTTATTKPTSPEQLEQALTTHSRQQEALTSDLLKMSRMLKESSLQFGKALEDEKPHLEQAALGLDKNILGMQGAGGRLERMRKDGSVGWYRTLINMAIILFLGVVGLVILLLPKLRR